MKDGLEPPESAGERYWERGWEEHERLQRQRLARLPFSEKLRWLEEAHKTVMRLRDGRDAAPKR